MEPGGPRQRRREATGGERGSVSALPPRPLPTQPCGEVVMSCVQGESESRTSIQLDEMRERHDATQMLLVRLLLTTTVATRAKGGSPHASASSSSHSFDQGRCPSLAPEYRLASTSAHPSLLFSELNDCMDMFWKAAVAVRAKLPEEAARCVRAELARLNGARGEDSNSDGQHPILGGTCSSHSTALEAKTPLRSSVRDAGCGGSSPYRPYVRYGKLERGQDVYSEKMGLEGKTLENDTLQFLALSMERMALRVDKLERRLTQASAHEAAVAVPAIPCKTCRQGGRDSPSPVSPLLPYHYNGFQNIRISAAVEYVRHMAPPSSFSSPLPASVVSLCDALERLATIFAEETGTRGATLETILSLPVAALPARVTAHCCSYLRDANNSALVALVEGLETLTRQPVVQPDEGRRRAMRAAAAALFLARQCLESHCVVSLVSYQPSPSQDIARGLPTHPHGSAETDGAPRETEGGGRRHSVEACKTRSPDVGSSLTTLEALLATTLAPSPVTGMKDDARASPSPNSTCASWERDGEAQRSGKQERKEKVGASWWPTYQQQRQGPHRTIPSPYDSFFPLPGALSAFTAPSTAPPPRFTTAPARTPQLLSQDYMSEEACPTLRGHSQAHGMEERSRPAVGHKHIWLRHHR